MSTESLAASDVAQTICTSRAAPQRTTHLHWVRSVVPTLCMKVWPACLRKHAPREEALSRQRRTALPFDGIPCAMLWFPRRALTVGSHARRSVALVNQHRQHGRGAPAGHGLLFYACYRRERHWTCSRIVYPDGDLIPAISLPLVLRREAITPRDVMDVSHAAAPRLLRMQCSAPHTARGRVDGAIAAVNAIAACASVAPTASNHDIRCLHNQLPAS